MSRFVVGNENDIIMSERNYSYNILLSQHPKKKGIEKVNPYRRTRFDTQGLGTLRGLIYVF